MYQAILYLRFKHGSHSGAAFFKSPVLVALDTGVSGLLVEGRRHIGPPGQHDRAQTAP